MTHKGEWVQEPELQKQLHVPNFTGMPGWLFHGGMSLFGQLSVSRIYGHARALHESLLVIDQAAAFSGVHAERARDGRAVEAPHVVGSYIWQWLLQKLRIPLPCQVPDRVRSTASPYR